MVSTVVGYTGGGKRAPTYRSLGDHTEAVLVLYDPRQVSYATLLEQFWSSHNPAHRSSYRQYRNVVFYHDAEQSEGIERSRAQLEQRLGRPVVTDVEAAGPFHAAEDYHQKYALRQYGALLRELRARYPDPVDFLASTAVARVNGYLGGHGSRAQLAQEVEQLGLSPGTVDKLRQRWPALVD